MLATIYIVIAVYTVYLNQMLQIRWRRWLTDRYLNEWLSRAHLLPHAADRQADRQPGSAHRRGPEDVRRRHPQPVARTPERGGHAGLVRRHPVGAVGRARAIPWARGASSSPATWSGWRSLYAIIGTWLTHKVGKPLIGLNFNQQRFEADFRYNLVRFRENTEGVALYRGEQGELAGFRDASATWSTTGGRS